MMPTTASSPGADQPTGLKMWLGRAQRRAKAVRGSIKRCPVIIVVPFLLCAALLGVGMYFVISIEANEIGRARDTALIDVTSLATGLQVGLKQAVQPVVQLADSVKHSPDFNVIYNTWSTRAADWWSGAPPGAAMLRMSPYGVVTTVWPITPVSSALVGRNVMAGILRNDSLEVISNRNATTSGPNWVAGRYEMLVRIPIFVPNTNKSSSYNIPIPPADCPEELCWLNSTRSKWWGFAVMDLEWSEFSAYTGRLDLIAKKYKYRITRPGDAFVAGVRVLASTKVVQESSNNAVPPTDALSASFDVFGKSWTIDVWKDEWTEGNTKAYIAVVAVIALLFSYMAFIILLTRFEHLALLHSLLPSGAIDRALDQWRWSAQDDLEQKLVMLQQGTPAEAIMAIVADLLAGSEPPLATITAVRSALLASADIYQPLAGDLHHRLATKDMDAEVQQALMNQLVGRTARGLTTVTEGEEGEEETNTQPEDSRHRGSAGPKRRTSTGSAPSDDSLHVFPTVQRERPSTEDHSGGVSPVHEVGLFATLHGALLAIIQGPRGAAMAAGIPPGAVRSSVQPDPRLLQIGSHYEHTEEEAARFSHAISYHRPSRVSLPTLETGDPHEDRQSKGFFGSFFHGHHKSSRASGTAKVGTSPAPAELHPTADKGSVLASASIDQLKRNVVAEPQVAIVMSESTEGHKKPRNRPAPKRAMSEQILIKSAHGAQQQPPNAYQEVPEKGLPTGLEAVLATANNWSFDAYELEVVSHGRPLSSLAFWLFHCTGVIDCSKLNRTKLARFLMRVEDTYLANPYHNKRHAADVLQTMHVLLHRGGLVPGYADNTVVLAAYLAAVVHDLEHVGRNNDFLVATQHDLAVIYNDKSPMENHHLAAAWYLLRNPEYNFLERMGKRTWARTRQLVVDMVLATDMKKHFQVVAQFSAVHRLTGKTSHSSPSDSFSNSVNNSNPGNSGLKNSTGGISMDTDGRDSHMTGSTMQIANRLVHLTPSSESDQLLSLQMALKLSDLGHLSAPLNVHLKWVTALEAEFFLQGDAEVALGLPPSPLCDRSKTGVTKSQVGFFDFVAIPLFNNFTHRFTAARPLYKNMMRNYSYWQIEAGMPSRPRPSTGSTPPHGSSSGLVEQLPAGRQSHSGQA